MTVERKLFEGLAAMDYERDYTWHPSGEEVFPKFRCSRGTKQQREKEAAYIASQSGPVRVIVQGGVRVA